METIGDFKYLGRPLNETNDDWTAIKYNLKKSRKIWSAVKRVLIRDKSSLRTMGYFYKAVVQSILLYRSETWVYTDKMLSRLRNFHNKIARRLTNQHIRPIEKEDGEWFYPNMEEVREKAGLWEIEEYITRRRETISVYARNESDLFHKCEASGKVGQRLNWWNLI